MNSSPAVSPRLIPFGILLLSLAGCGGNAPAPVAKPGNPNTPVPMSPASTSPTSPTTTAASSDKPFMPFENPDPIEEPRLVEAAVVKELEGRHVRFHPDGKKAYAAEKEIRVYDVRTWELSTSWPRVGKEIDRIEISRDGRVLIAAHEGGQVSVWDTATGENVYKFTHPASEDTMTGDTFQTPRNFAISPDGEWVASGEGGNFECFLWQATTGKVQWKWTTEWRDVKPADFNPSGDTIAAMGMAKIDFRDAATGQVKQSISLDYKGVVDDVRYSPNGEQLLVWCKKDDPDRSVMALFDTRTRALLWKRETGFRSMYSTAYSPDGNTIAVAGELPRKENDDDRRIIQFRNPKDGKLRFASAAKGMNFLARLAFSPDGNLLAAGHVILRVPEAK